MSVRVSKALATDLNPNVKTKRNHWPECREGERMEDSCVPGVKLTSLVGAGGDARGQEEWLKATTVQGIQERSYWHSCAHDSRVNMNQGERAHTSASYISDQHSWEQRQEGDFLVIPLISRLYLMGSVLVRNPGDPWTLTLFQWSWVRSWQNGKAGG